MNYLNIEGARKKYSKHLEELQRLESQINLSLLVLGQTSPSPQTKSQAWKVLKQKGENMRKEMEQELYKLEETHFSVESDSLKEEKHRLINQYQNLIEALSRKESAIAEQMEKKLVPVVPFRQITPEKGRCYYCRVDITNSFSYQLEKEVQAVSNIKIVEGAKFCSQNCLSKYCEKYQKWDESQKAEQEKLHQRIISQEEMLKHLQGKMTNLQRKINDLEREEQELEALLEREILMEEKRKVSRWQRFLWKIGIGKDNSPSIKLQRIKEIKQDYELELAEKEKQIGRATVKLSMDKQFKKKWEEKEKSFLRLVEKKEEEEENE